MLYRLLFVTFFFIGTLNLTANNDPQRPAPTWNIQFKSTILWQQITPLGNLVINTRDGLFGIDGQTGQRTWEIKGLGNLPAHSYRSLPNTFFAELVLPDAIVIIDPYDGRIIGDTKKAGFKDVIAKNLLYESGTLLVYGFKNDLQAYLSIFDVKTGKELWSGNEIFQKSKTGLGGLLNTLKVASELNDEQGTAAFDIIEVSKEQFIIATGSGLFNISTYSGEVTWQADLPTPQGAISTTSSSKLIRGHSSQQFYFAKSNYIMAYNLKDGSQAWEKVTKINGLVNEVISYNEGLILLPHIDPNNNMFGVKLSYVDAKTGAKSWGNKNKGLKLPGSVVDYQWVKNGLVLSMQSDEKSFLNILDPQNGTFIFDDHLKIKGALDYTEMTPAGLLYFTSATKYGKGEVNIFDLKTGKPKFPKSITAKFGDGAHQTSLLRDFKDQLVYVFTHDGNALYEINLDNGALRLLREGIKLEGKEEVTTIEVREQGILLSSHQNVMMIDFNGKGTFQKYYPAPTEPGIIKALYAMQSVTAALYSAQYHMMSASLDQAADQMKSESGRQLVEEVSGAYQNEGRELQAYSKAAMSRAKARFSATQQGNNHVFMMIALDKQKTGVAKALEGRKFALVRVSKETGDIQELIDMQNEKEPSYQVDNISNAIFYRVQPNEIISYRF